MSCADPDCARRIAALERENAMLATDNDLMTEKAKQAFRAEQAAKNRLNGQIRTDDRATEIRGVCDYWKQTCGHPNAVIEATSDDDRWNAVRRRLEHFSPVQLMQAINGAARFPYVIKGQGRSQTGSRKQRYDDLELICRNARKVQEFMDFALDEDGEPVEVQPNEPVVNASLFEEAIQEAAKYRRTCELLKDMVQMSASWCERLEAENAELSAALEGVAT